VLSPYRIALPLACTVTLLACTATPGRQPTIEQELTRRNFQVGERVERIQQWRIDGWSYLDRQHVIMQTAPSTYYLVSLKNACYGLSTVENIAFTTTSSQLTRFDKLLVRRGRGSIEHCYIESLNRLHKAKASGRAEKP